MGGGSCTVVRGKGVVQGEEELLEIGVHHYGCELCVMQRKRDDIVDQLFLLLLRLHFLGDGGQEVLQQFFILLVSWFLCYYNSIVLGFRGSL